MGFEPTTLRDLAGRSNHWVTGDTMVRKGEIWSMWLHDAVMSSYVPSHNLAVWPRDAVPVKDPHFTLAYRRVSRSKLSG